MWRFVKTKSRTSDKWEGVYDTFEPVVHGGKYIVSIHDHSQCFNLREESFIQFLVIITYVLCMECDVGIARLNSWNHTRTGWLCTKKCLCYVHLLWEQACHGDSICSWKSLYEGMCIQWPTCYPCAMGNRYSSIQGGLQT